MIRHVVMWKLAATEPAAKAAAVAEIAGALEPLVGVVPGLQSLIVRPNVAYLETNYDAILVSDFESISGLEAYQVHPAHVAAAAVPRAHAASRVTVDFEV
mgnify:CR=1 FL=1